MKAKLLMAAGAFALLVSPVFAQSQGQGQGQGQGSAAQAQKPAAAAQRATTGSAPKVRGPNDVYDCTGKYLGSDPDANIRLQILREGENSKSCN